jgi:hypothetical protein
MLTLWDAYTGLLYRLAKLLLNRVRHPDGDILIELVRFMSQNNWFSWMRAHSTDGQPIVTMHGLSKVTELIENAFISEARGKR